jgi:hypothetical protein
LMGRKYFAEGLQEFKYNSKEDLAPLCHPGPATLWFLSLCKIS